MPAAVSPKRPYRSKLRESQAEQTRTVILAAARRLFVDQGWTRTTIAAIAKDAGVATETVYSVFGSKRSLLERMIENAVRGNDPEVPLLRQAAPRRVAETADQRRQLHLFAKSICVILDRVAPLVATARSASESEVPFMDIYQFLHQGRRRNLAFVAEALVRNGPLRDGMSPEAATDCIFRLASPELFLLMRHVEGRSLEEISFWLEESLAKLLLPQEASKPPA